MKFAGSGVAAAPGVSPHGLGGRIASETGIRLSPRAKTNGSKNSMLFAITYPIISCDTFSCLDTTCLEFGTKTALSDRDEADSGMDG